MASISPEKLASIGKILNDPSLPLKQRFRALFTLRNLKGETAIDYIRQCFSDPSALLQHELAYCLGQMQDERAIPILIKILEDKSRDPMVRHEAGEALGAIASEEAIDVLKKYSTDSEAAVAETCQLAVNRIQWLKENAIKSEADPQYFSVDPAPPEKDTRSAEELAKVFLNDSDDLFQRYKAMFALRNLNSKESIDVLCQGLQTGGALFRHEVAFVLGQLQSEHSVPALIQALEDVSQNEMVRHECAEALGSIATDECVEILQRYLTDKSDVVRESCFVALDMAEYEMSDEFQYANTAALVNVN